MVQKVGFDLKTLSAEDGVGKFVDLAELGELSEAEERDIATSIVFLEANFSFQVSPSRRLRYETNPRNENLREATSFLICNRATGRIAGNDELPPEVIVPEDSAGFCVYLCRVQIARRQDAHKLRVLSVTSYDPEGFTAGAKRVLANAIARWHDTNPTTF